MQRLVVLLFLVCFFTVTVEAQPQADYIGGGLFGGNGSRGFDKTDLDYEEYDVRGITSKAGKSDGSHNSVEGSATIMKTRTALQNQVLFLGVDLDFIATLYKRQSHFINPFISLGLGSYYFNGDTDNNNSTYNESEGIALNAKVGLYIKVSSHIEIEAHMHGKSFLWNGSENDTSNDARRRADSMTNFYLGLNWHI